jgi:hypothetical protein
MLRHNDKGLSMDTIRTVLGDNPEIGILGSFIAFITPFIDTIGPVCQLISMALGIAISIYTLKIQIKRWKNIRDKK